MTNRDKIKREVLARGIKCLVHFTPAINAKSILSHGLAARPLLDENNISYLSTDELRGDKKLDAVSLSIGLVNYAMLEAKQKNYRGQWVIFALHPSILWTHSCRFCWTNAASREVRDNHGYLGGPWGFRRMFETKPVSAIDPRCRREVYGYSDGTPTDNAAEVQVFDPIDSDLIISIGVRTKREKTKLEALMIDINRVREVELVDHIFA